MSSTLIPKIKYLTNKDLLAAIHESKLTFCEFDDPIYRNYDLIVHSLDTVSEQTLHAARLKKLADLQTEERREQKNKNFESKLSMDDVPLENVVVRLMTYDHIPVNPLKADRAKTVAERHVRCQFPPFQHYVWENSNWRCVGRSHCKNGEFSLHHGKVTNRLGAMWMKLVERYGHRGNWRGYTYLDEMKAQALMQLSQVGLQFDESKSSNPFSYYTQCVATSFLKILTTEKKTQTIRDDLLIMHGSTPSNTRVVEDQIAQRNQPDLPAQTVDPTTADPTVTDQT
jgi:hypothetical protein